MYFKNTKFLVLNFHFQPNAECSNRSSNGFKKLKHNAYDSPANDGTGAYTQRLLQTLTKQTKKPILSLINAGNKEYESNSPVEDQHPCGKLTDER